MVYSWIKNIQPLPAACTLCGDTMNADALCRACTAELPWNGVTCRTCALPLPEGAGHDAMCGECQRQPPPVTRVLAPLRYAAPVDYLLQRMKFNQKLHLAAFFGRLLADYIDANSRSRPDVIVPVPLHDTRLRQRGFNQSLELARPIAARWGIALDYSHCLRMRATAAQSELPATERRKNIRGAFAVKGTLPQRVAIVDDVMTTGSTMWEMAKTLRGAGAKEIDVWVCARAV